MASGHGRRPEGGRLGSTPFPTGSCFTRSGRAQGVLQLHLLTHGLLKRLDCGPLPGLRALGAACIGCCRAPGAEVIVPGPLLGNISYDPGFEIPRVRLLSVLRVKVWRVQSDLLGRYDWSTRDGLLATLGRRKDYGSSMEWAIWAMGNSHRLLVALRKKQGVNSTHSKSPDLDSLD